MSCAPFGNEFLSHLVQRGEDRLVPRNHLVVVFHPSPDDLSRQFIRLALELIRSFDAGCITTKPTWLAKDKGENEPRESNPGHADQHEDAHGSFSPLETPDAFF
jgi:hypothetical protein